MPFAIGQRWISESENNLGLGIVTELDKRTLTLFFPAAEETRIYALAAAPLVRLSFQVGDEIYHREGWKGKVKQVMQHNALFFYLVQPIDSIEEIVIHEKDLAAQITYSKPQERLFSLQFDPYVHFSLRYKTLLHQQEQATSLLRGLRGCRAALIPHQLYIAQEVGQRLFPRVLLADEVGLGKTIEAGMILQQQLLAEKVERVLIVVPETLQHQWLVEMLRRFNLHFSLFDEERCTDFDVGGNQAINPFQTENLIICSLHWLMQQPNRAKQLLACEFDLLIVDEAHHLAWNEQQSSPEYEFIAQLSRQIPAVLLLTATPEQLGQQSHFARLHLLDPHRFYDYSSFVQEQTQYQPVAEAVQSLLGEAQLSIAAQNVLMELLGKQEVEPYLHQLHSNLHKEQQYIARTELIHRLLDRHGTSRILFRNTRQGVKGFPKRNYHQISLEMPKAYQKAMYQQDLEQQSKAIHLYPEQAYSKENNEILWWKIDPRVDWLVDFLQTHRTEKVLVICRYVSTAMDLEQALREKEGIRSAVFHEKMSIIERDRAAAYFAQKEEGAQVLLSSSIGSEGRNFQFACHLVLFNLPEQPDLLEQCIGRLDRIGQARDVHIHVPYFNRSIQQRLARWYHEGINAFEETCPMATILFTEIFDTTYDEQNDTKNNKKCGEKSQYFFQNTLQNMLQYSDVAFEQLLQHSHQRQQQLKLELEQGRDRLLELNSHGGEIAYKLAKNIEKEDNSEELKHFTQYLFDIIGVEQDDLDEKTTLITPSGTMLLPDFPGLKEEGIIVTFDRQLALTREEVEFLTWDHPIIRNGIDLVLGSHLGKSAVALLVNKNLPEGTLLLELIFVVEAQAPKGLQLTRFLPPTPIRLLLDMQGNEIGKQVSFARIEQQLKPLEPLVASKIIKGTRPRIERLLTIAEQKILLSAKEIIAQSHQQAEQHLTAELQRLIALKKVNNNIRLDEITALEQHREQILAQLAQATWRLDSLRVIISNNE